MRVPNHDVSLGGLLLALAREIDGPRQAILAAEHHLAAALRSAPPIEGAARDLQNIDLALQILNDLEGFIARLATDLPDDLRVNVGPALKGLALERVAAGLGALGIQQPTSPAQPSIELF
jgi:hypothetical protein